MASAVVDYHLSPFLVKFDAIIESNMAENLFDNGRGFV